MISVHGFHTLAGDDSHDDLSIFEDDVLGADPILGEGDADVVDSAVREENVGSIADGVCENGKCTFRALEVIGTRCKDDNEPSSTSESSDLKRDRDDLATDATSDQACLKKARA